MTSVERDEEKEAIEEVALLSRCYPALSKMFEEQQMMKCSKVPGTPDKHLHCLVQLRPYLD
jgi:hypothetical protein